MAREFLESSIVHFVKALVHRVGICQKLFNDRFNVKVVSDSKGKLMIFENILVNL